MARGEPGTVPPVQIGLTMFATDRTMDPVALAREAEARGFHSLYLPEHTHIPVSRRTRPPPGAVVLGVGFGWNEDEIAQHGVAMRDRRAIAREHVLAMRALWRDEIAEYHGEH